MKKSEFNENSSDIDYNLISPKRQVRVFMRAKYKGRGKPLPYILDEESE
jgi:hypothetical protein